jgi:hypothetical protein
MLHSLLQKENLKVWSVGMVDLDTAIDKAKALWEELEARFDMHAMQASPNVLKEEEDEWKDANK